MTLTAEELAAKTPEEQLAYFHERRELSVVQPLGSLALTNTQLVESEQPIWGVPGRWAPRPAGESGLTVIAGADDDIRVDGVLVDGEAVVRGKDDPNPSEIVFSDTVRTALRPALHGDSSGVRGAAWLADRASVGA